MNPLLMVWVRWIGVLALEIAVIAGMAAQLQQLTKSAVWRRAIGHVCLLSLLLLVVLEFSGTARNLSGWVRTDVKVHAVPPHPGPFPWGEGESSSVVENPRPGATTSLNSSPSVFPNHAQNSRPVATGDGRIRASGIAQTAQQAGDNRSIIKFATRHVPIKPLRAKPSYESLWLLAGALAWLAGAVVVMGRVLCGGVALEIFRWRRQRMGHLELLACVRELARRLGIRREVRLMESPQICGPVAFGILRPTIGLPVDFMGKFGAEEREVMLAHELAHLAGHDPAWYLLANALAAILWWHPLVWWTRRRLHTASELAADEASLLLADGPRVLAECLVEIGGQLAQRRAFRELGVGGNGFRSGLGRRVERLVGLEGGHWRPLNQFRGGLIRTLGPMLLASATILCTAWVFPPAINQGDSMPNIIKQTWKKSLATLALLTSISADINPALAQASPPPPPAAPDAQQAMQQVLQNAQADQQARMKQIQDEVAKQNAQILKQAAEIQKQAANMMSADQFPGQPTIPSTEYQQGLQPLAPTATPNPPFHAAPPPFVQPDSLERQAVVAKLGKITLDSVQFDHLPLSEIVKKLVELSAARDPDKVGVNFVLKNEPASAPGSVQIDPNTGLPGAMAAEPVDLAGVTVNINPPLKHVRLIDVLDVITTVADSPINYAVTDYGVLFSSNPPRHRGFQVKLNGAGGGTGGGGAAGFVSAAPVQWEVKTFKVDTNTFYAGLDRMFGIKLKAISAGQPRETQDALKNLLSRLGIDMSKPNKSIFYNDVTGIIMVRGTYDDLQLVEATIETLGGYPYTPPGGNPFLGRRPVGGFMGGGAVGGGSSGQ
jgi:hypothetical protein